MTQVAKPKSIIAGLMVGLGLGLTLFFGLRTLQSFRRMPPFPPGPPRPSETDVDSVRAWMNLTYISKVYAIPPDYLNRYLEIPAEMDETHLSLTEINQSLDLGETSDKEPLLLDRVKDAITEFHTNASGPELGEIRSSMSIQYIAAVTGVPSASIFESLGLAKGDNSYKSLAVLSDEFQYEGGWETLAQDIDYFLEADKGK